MEKKRYRPLIDRLFVIIASATLVITLTPTVVCGILAPSTIYITLPILLFTLYFLISPLFGYVELGERSVYIRYGFIMTKEIEYDSIRCIEHERRVISPSVMSVKNALEHVNIKYNKFDVTTVSVKTNRELIAELNARCGGRLIKPASGN
jgi:hypothetical protein